MSRTLYRNFWIEYDPPPIPDRNHDWRWAHEDYDGPGDRRCGTSASLEAARAEIDEWYLENLERDIAEEFEPEADSE